MNYSFLTTGGFRIDASGKNPRQAYKIAQNKLIKSKEQLKSKKIIGDKIELGELSKTYFKYDKDGLHAVNGAYYQLNSA